MDLSVRSTPGAPVADHSWLAGDSAAFDNAQSGTLDVSEFISGTHYDALTKVMPAGVAVAEVGGVLIPFAGANEVQTVTITGTPSGGTFTLTFDGETTAAIVYNPTASAVQAALEALSNLDPGDVIVSGSTGGPFTVTFGGKRGGRNVTQLTSTPSLTGGSTPSVTHATTTGGGAGAAGADKLFGFLAHPEVLLRDNGTVSDVAAVAVIVDATINPSRLPVAAQRTINENTPTSGKFGFVNR